MNRISKIGVVLICKTLITLIFEDLTNSEYFLINLPNSVVLIDEPNFEAVTAVSIMKANRYYNDKFEPHERVFVKTNF